MKIIFKHSPLCPVSRRAKDEMERFLETNKQELEYEFIDVIANRGRSNEVAEIHGVEHESPQVIVLDDRGEVIWDASHREITELSIRDAVS